MKKTLSAPLVLLLIGLISMTTIRQAQAGIDSITWILPAWRNKSDSYFGTTVAYAYVAGSTWTMNVMVNSDATNGTNDMDARVLRIAVWFEWNKFYNTTLDVTIKHGDTYLFTINGTTEQTTIASNLFLHSYKVYVEYEINYLKDGAAVTERRTWGPLSYGGFAVLSQDQYDAEQASKNYEDLKNAVSTYVDDYAESNNLFIQAKMKARMAETAYTGGDFSGALEHYNNASSLLEQAFAVYTSKDTAYEKADLDMEQAQVNAVQANATARLIEANGLATAMMINAAGFAFFGLGFIFFGLAAIYYARRPRTPPPEK
jgi:hypothetical protein